MVFSSVTFLFLFLPLTLIVYSAAPRKWRNFILLLASLFFYAWGEGLFVILMMCSITVNYFFGIIIDKNRHLPIAKTFLFSAIFVNLLSLSVFKYLNFIVDNLNALLSILKVEPIVVSSIHLPIGISFFTFQALTYVVDVYRGDAPAQRSPLKVALYISLFPQLIAGPILRVGEAE